MLNVKKQKGFTFVELMVALSISAIILGSVATLAYATTMAANVSEQSSQVQSQLRLATMRVVELIRNCKLICSFQENNLAIWRADDNGDGRMNLSELVYLGSDLDRNYLRLFEYMGSSQILNPIGVAPMLSGWQSYGCNNYRSTKLLPECRNLSFFLDDVPPWTKRVSICFKLEDNGEWTRYQITASLRAWSGYLFDSTGSFILADDDQVGSVPIDR